MGRAGRAGRARSRTPGGVGGDCRRAIRAYNRDVMGFPELRVGHGYDIHRLEPGRSLVIGGVRIPSERGAAGHSDADVLMHAVVDALLGAAKAGDIGRHFPDTDPAYRDADSRRFLAETAELVRARGWETVNIDASVLLQEPKLSPHVAAMERNIAERLGMAPERVSVKAKTNERQDAVGQARAVACHAVVLLARAESASGPG